MHHPSFQDFQINASKWDTIPVYREVQADLLTPVSAYLSLETKGEAFLLESVEGGEKWARYSFVGYRPRARLTIRGKELEIAWRTGEVTTTQEEDPIGALVEFGLSQNAMPVPALPRFSGGLVGVFAYDMVRHVEHLPDPPANTLDLPDAAFLLTDVLIVFDSKRQSAFVISHARIQEHETPKEAYRAACTAVDDTIAAIQSGPKTQALIERPLDGSDLAPVDRVSLEADAFQEKVERALEYVRAGDIIQVVLSRRFSTHDGGIPPFEVYRMLRGMNPSPYLFFLEFPSFSLAGASPEVLVRFREGIAEVRPIAGTRKRGKDTPEDEALAADLQKDPKEVAEHIMLLDLGRNDIGRIAQPGTVTVPDQMVIELYSHVMHMVSSVQGKTREGVGPREVIRATFPAGTLSGAPKVRAMEVIDELEPVRRGFYGGAVGYIDFQGDMDLCIAIRSLVASQGEFHVQAGAGIVYDSDPAKETDETEIKARAVLRAIEMARVSWNSRRGNS